MGEGAESGQPRRRDRLVATLRVLTTAEMLVVAGVAFMFGALQTMLRPLVAPYALELGLGPFLAGMVVATQSLPGLLLAVPAGSVADRWGSTRILIGGGSLLGTGGLLLAAVPTFAGLFASMLLIGLGTLGVALSVHGLATEPVGDDLDTRRVASFGTFVLIGQLVGPILGGVLTDTVGYAAAFTGVAAIGVLLVIVGTAYRRRRARVPRPDGPQADDAEEARADEGAGPRNPYRKAHVLLREPGILGTVAVSGMGALLVNLRQSFLPLYLSQIDWSASAIGVLLSAAATAALVARATFPVVERHIRPKLLLRSSVAAGALSLAVAVSTPDTALIVAGAVTSGVLLGGINPVTLTMLGRLASEGRRSLALGMRITANRFGQAAGPIGFGALAAAGSVRVAFFVMTSAAALVSALATRRLPNNRLG